MIPYFTNHSTWLVKGSDVGWALRIIMFHSKFSLSLYLMRMCRKNVYTAKQHRAWGDIGHPCLNKEAFRNNYSLCFFISLSFSLAFSFSFSTSIINIFYHFLFWLSRRRSLIRQWAWLLAHKDFANRMTDKQKVSGNQHTEFSAWESEKVKVVLGLEGVFFMFLFLFSPPFG